MQRVTDESRRYVGRSGRRPISRQGSYPPVGPAAPESLERRSQLELAGADNVAVPVTRWSIRLLSVVLGILLLVVGLRVLPGFTTAVDAPLGVESTHAALVNVIAGRLPTLQAGSNLAPPMPWLGRGPVDPVAGLPLYSWLAAALTNSTGETDVAGRTASILFSVLAGLFLFALVHRTAGARAAVYASVLYAIAPLSITLGRQFSPASLILASQALAVLILVRWRSTVSDTRPRGSVFVLIVACGLALVNSLVDPGSIFLAAPAAALLLSSADAPGGQPWLSGSRASVSRLRRSWRTSNHRGTFACYVSVLAGGAILWKVFISGHGGLLQLGVTDGGGGIASMLAALASSSSYVQVVGMTVENILTMLGLLFLVAGLLYGARPPFRTLYAAWLAGAVVHALLDAGRLPGHADVLLPLLLPACALVGIGAAWSASFPSRVWLAITERRSNPEDEYTVSPHTAWLLDLPEERIPTQRQSRPQAQIAFGKNLAERSRQAGLKARKATFVLVGHAAAFAFFGIMLWSGWPTLQAKLTTVAESLDLENVGREVAASTTPDASIIVAGPNAPEIFYSSKRAGWALSTVDFNMSAVQTLQRKGASYLLTTDQDWLGHHPDYVGLLANYSVSKLSRRYIMFDLRTKPAASDRLYFLESGHTLGGEFRRFWELKGGVQKLGYPVSEEYQEASPLDGQVRTVQYFERAILESHPEFAGTGDSVMIAAAGRWVTAGREFPRVAPFKNLADRAYFPQTGHGVKEAFLRFWQTQGGLALFGYPISEEMPEISFADGKVYTIQYFERARFEWHPTDAGTPKEVQLGLIGKQALEVRK